MTTEPTPARRKPWGRQALHLARRLHLYLGLFLLPWAVLYGVTAFLFNHPTAFSDADAIDFGSAALVGTPLERLPTPAEYAAELVAALSASGTPYTLAADPPPRYNREFAFATARAADGRTVSLLLDPLAPGGSLRVAPAPGPPDPVAPFAVTPFAPPTPAKLGGGLTLPGTLAERFRDAIPTILERTNTPAGTVTVTSVPDLVFVMSNAAGERWQVTYNALTGSVAGKPLAAAEERKPPTVRGFLTRLHLARGYPSAGGPRWYWGIVVDAMAAAMLFWGVSGLAMWWQVRATRRAGGLALLASMAVAAWLAAGMYAGMRQAQ